ncbi:hypothetical protein HNQ37_000759 [Lactovum miscens]|uniref:Uncharacterized protein n=1 Tax=Lactovum miscens TaxID=190387 RepID=A0A841C9K7_9LACT|nr:hypothetical protein [Lactovum miscens]
MKIPLKKNETLVKARENASVESFMVEVIEIGYHLLG